MLQGLCSVPLHCWSQCTVYKCCSCHVSCHLCIYRSFPFFDLARLLFVCLSIFSSHPLPFHHLYSFPSSFYFFFPFSVVVLFVVVAVVCLFCFFCVHSWKHIYLCGAGNCKFSFPNGLEKTKREIIGG